MRRARREKAAPLAAAWRACRRAPARVEVRGRDDPAVLEARRVAEVSVLPRVRELEREGLRLGEGVRRARSGCAPRLPRRAQRAGLCAAALDRRRPRLRQRPRQSCRAPRLLAAASRRVPRIFCLEARAAAAGLRRSLGPARDGPLELQALPLGLRAQVRLQMGSATPSPRPRRRPREVLLQRHRVVDAGHSSRSKKKCLQQRESNC
mmetsp:Transcript_6212/g.26023  ORF Transcript_6212/g.26023 Transcript_6212/m.26023 type:complete len:207 (+) Transcript_6212:1477-2097(+)